LEVRGDASEVEEVPAYNLHEHIDIHIYYVARVELHHSNKELVYNVNKEQVDAAHNEQVAQTRSLEL
jgi:hypothetical protein